MIRVDSIYILACVDGKGMGKGVLGVRQTPATQAIYIYRLTCNKYDTFYR